MKNKIPDNAEIAIERLAVEQAEKNLQLAQQRLIEQLIKRGIYYTCRTGCGASSINPLGSMDATLCGLCWNNNYDKAIKGEI